MRLLLALALAAAFWLDPPLARAASDPPKGPLDYSLKQYALTLGIAVLGGLVSWLAKVRAGQVAPFAATQLVGELATAAFAGVLAFWLCEWAATPPLLSVAMTGIAGHMGTRAVALFESFAARRFGAASNKGGPDA